MDRPLHNNIEYLYQIRASTIINSFTVHSFVKKEFPKKFTTSGFNTLLPTRPNMEYPDNIWTTLFFFFSLKSHGPGIPLPPRAPSFRRGQNAGGERSSDANTNYLHLSWCLPSCGAGEKERIPSWGRWECYRCSSGRIWRQRKVKGLGPWGKATWTRVLFFSSKPIHI